MRLIGHDIKSSNFTKVIILLGIGIVWRIVMGDTLNTQIRDPYIFPVIGFLMVSVILGELTCRLYRFFVKIDNSKPKPILEMQGDQEALYFGIGWGIFFILLTLFLKI